MAYDQIHIVDATSQMIEVALRSSTTGMMLTGKAYGDMTIKYQREGAASAATVSVVTATKGTWTSGGFVETDIAGLYQFGIPNAALATGAKAVTITFACTGAIDAVKKIVLIGADLRNVNSLGLAYLTGAVALEATLTAIKGATFNGTTDSLEALRDRGDAAWTTATGFATPTNITAASGVALTSAYDAAKTAATQTSVDDLPTNSELATALGTADDATLAAIAALNNLSSAQAQSAATAALNAYDPPTNAELEARTLVAASYFDPAADTVARVTLVDTTTTLTNMPAGGGLDAAGVRGAIGMAAANLDTQLGTVAKTGADSDTLETLSDQIDALVAGSGLTAQQTRDAMKLAPTAGAPATGSIDAELDAIRLITDAIDTSAVIVAASNDAGLLTIIQSVTFNATVSGLTISGTWAKVYWSLKESLYDTDAESIIQLVASNPAAPLTDGLLYLDSAAIVAPITVADGTLTVNQAGGTVVIAVTDNATALLAAASELVWDIKTKDAAGNTVQNTTGTASIVRAVTQTI